MVCFRYIIVNTLHKGVNKYNNNNNNNKNQQVKLAELSPTTKQTL